MTSAPQVLLDPSQVSAVSQTPAEARQTVVLDATASPGHAALAPVQDSATSQAPVAARHSVPEPTRTSAGQSLLDPLQLSATSQAPEEDLQTAVLLTSLGQRGLVPSQTS